MDFNFKVHALYIFCLKERGYMTTKEFVDSLSKEEVEALKRLLSTYNKEKESEKKSKEEK